jgi:acyl-CoA reductase-like NAD-dependent aldehyde dehydrogenase
MNEADIRSIVSNQKKFFSSGETKKVPFRLQQIRKLKTAIVNNETKIMEALWADMKKPRFEAYTTEVGCVLCEIDRHLHGLKSWVKPVKVRTPLIHIPASTYAYPEPLGVVLIIAPWNYPFHLAVLPVVGAIAAGNCAVIKPSEISPNTSHVIVDIVRENFDPAFITVVEGEAETSKILVSQRFDHIFFTGGGKIGSIIMEAAAKNLTPITLELGGKSPCVVDKDINVEYTARRIVWGKFLNAGQTCVAPDYVLVDRAVKTQLIECMKTCLRQFYGEDPSRSSDYARIINQKQFDRLTGLLTEGTVSVGGQTKKDDLYIAPTIIDNISLGHRVMQEEIFGPILPVMEYDELDEAIAIVNKLPKPLAFYFFSRSRKKQETIQNETSSGGLCINDAVNHMVSSLLPFGGVGESGFGRYHGKASFDTFSHQKGVLRKSFLFDVRLKYPPYNKKLKLIKGLLHAFLH